MKKILFILGIFGFILLLNADKVAVFPGLAAPAYLVADGGQIIISDYPFVYLYSLNDYGLLKKMGGEGMGPGEFYIRRDNMNLKERGLVISICPGHIAVNSMSRLSFFTRKGDFKNEVRIPYGINAKFLSLGEKLLGFLPGNGKLSVILFDFKLNKQKEIFKCNYWFNLSRSKTANFFDRAADTLLVSIHDKKIFFARGDAPSIAIDVFDFDGNKRYTVKHKSEKVEIPQRFIQKIHQHFKVKFRGYDDYFLKELNLPEYFPGIRHFAAAGNKIYVFTFKKLQDKNEVIIFDIKGNFLKKTFLPAREENPERLYPFSFYKNRFYQLIENEENENWELHVVDVK